MIDEWKSEGERAGWGNLIYTKPQSRMGGIFCGVLFAIYYCERCEAWWLVDGKPQGKREVSEYPDERTDRWTKRQYFQVGLAVFILLFHMLTPWSQLVDDPCLVANHRWPQGRMTFSYICPEIMPRWWGVFHYTTFRIMFSASLAYLGYEWLCFRSLASRAAQDTTGARFCIGLFEGRVWYLIAQLSFGTYLLNPYGVGIAFLYILPDYNIDDRTSDWRWILFANIISITTTFCLAAPFYMFVEAPGIGLSNVFRNLLNARSDKMKQRPPPGKYEQLSVTEDRLGVDKTDQIELVTLPDEEDSHECH